MMIRVSGHMGAVHVCFPLHLVFVGPRQPSMPNAKAHTGIKREKDELEEASSPPHATRNLVYVNDEIPWKALIGCWKDKMFG